MTATDELRRMLDERAVEWDGESYERVTFWNEETNLAVASDDRDGKLWMSMRVTPEQAIEATLGRGTCHMTEQNDGFGWWECSECGGILPAPDIINYCPNCGRRVAAGDGE